MMMSVVRQIGGDKIL